jgi:hypothetical protein
MYRIRIPFASHSHRIRITQREILTDKNVDERITTKELAGGTDYIILILILILVFIFFIFIFLKLLDWIGFRLLVLSKIYFGLQ